jgi:hypothetical protein
MSVRIASDALANRQDVRRVFGLQLAECGTSSRFNVNAVQRAVSRLTLNAPAATPTVAPLPEHSSTKSGGGSDGAGGGGGEAQ